MIYSLVEVHHSSVEELEEVRREKREIRGGFEERVYLIDVKIRLGPQTSTLLKSARFV